MKNTFSIIYPDAVFFRSNPDSVSVIRFISNRMSNPDLKQSVTPLTKVRTYTEKDIVFSGVEIRGSGFSTTKAPAFRIEGPVPLGALESGTLNNESTRI